MQPSTLVRCSALALAVLLSACTVDDSTLDTALFACANDGSCGTGWGLGGGSGFTMASEWPNRCVDGPTGHAATRKGGGGGGGADGFAWPFLAPP